MGVRLMNLPDQDSVVVVTKAADEETAVEAEQGDGQVDGQVERALT